MAEKQTPAQRRYAKLSDAADADKEPFKSGGPAQRIIKEQQRDSKDGFFELPRSAARAMGEDIRNVRKAKSDAAMDRITGTKLPERPSPLPKIPEKKFPTFKMAEPITRKLESKPEPSREPDRPDNFPQKPIASLRKGGPINQTGNYRLHAGERVLNNRETKRFESGKRMSGRRSGR